MQMPQEAVSSVIQPGAPQTCRAHPTDWIYYVNHKNIHRKQRTEANIKDSHTD